MFQRYPQILGSGSEGHARIQRPLYPVQRGGQDAMAGCLPLYNQLPHCLRGRKAGDRLAAVSVSSPAAAGGQKSLQTGLSGYNSPLNPQLLPPSCGNCTRCGLNSSRKICLYRFSHKRKQLSIQYHLAASASSTASRLWRSTSGPRSTVVSCPSRTTTLPLTTV